MDITSIEELKNYNSEYHSKEERKEDPVYVMEWWTEWIFTQKEYEDFKVGVDELVKFTKDYEDLNRDEAIIRTIRNLRFCYSRFSIDSNEFEKNLNKILIYYWGYIPHSVFGRPKY